MKRLIGITVGVGFILFLIFILFSTGRDESQIRKNLGLLRGLLEKSSDENPIAALGKARKAGTFFVDDCNVRVGSPVPDINGNGQLVAIVQQARKSAYEVKVRFSDISVLISDDRNTASVSMTASAIACEAGGAGRNIEAREVEMSWVKLDRVWKIKEVRAVETLH